MEKNKPDFDELVKQHLRDNLPPSANIDLHVAKSYKTACEHIWTNYVTPLQYQLSEAEKRIKVIDEEANHWMNQCLDKCAKLDKAQSQNERLLSALKEREWIDVKERLPEYMETCIIHTDVGFVTMAQFGGGIKPVFCIGQEWHIADYWQPLPIFKKPEPPKQLINSLEKQPS